MAELHIRDHLAESPRSARVCVVGAGASGVVAAATLRELGYESVTVLEREPRLGGKCFTVEHDGRPYEVGAGGLSPLYRTVRALAKEHGLTPTAVWSGLNLDLETGRHSSVPPPLRAGGWLGLPADLARLARELMRHRRLYRPGFEGVDPTLHRPFAEVSTERGLELVSAICQPWFTAFGYGHYETVPAAYVLKYATLAGPFYELVDSGYQGLLERIAAPLDVRLGCAVRAIARSEDGVEVRTDDGTTRHDALVMACPPDASLSLLDATAEERDLLSRVRTNPYFAVGTVVEGLPRARYMFVPAHYSPGTLHVPLFGYRRFEEHDVVFFYAYGRDLSDGDAVVEGVTQTVERLGGRVRSVLKVQPWSFFPHVGTDDLDGGFYARLEGMQGARRTWHVGELHAFSTVESVASYARWRIRRSFGSEVPPDPSMGFNGR